MSSRLVSTPSLDLGWHVDTPEKGIQEFGFFFEPPKWIDREGTLEEQTERSLASFDAYRNSVEARKEAKRMEGLQNPKNNARS